SALEAMRSVRPRADIARVGIVAWYYGTYCAASAMIAAQDGSFQDTHKGTANRWDNQLSARKLVMKPFDLRVSTLIKKDANREIQILRAGNKYDLKSAAETPSDAWGACCSYLSGTAEWYRLDFQEHLKTRAEFKRLGVTSFQTKAARELRESGLQRKTVSFLHQAYRYRGKAN